MNTLPRAAQAYLIALWIVAFSLLAWALSWLPAYPNQHLLLPLWTLLVVFVDYFEVEIDSGDDTIRATTTDAGMLFLVAVSGLPGTLAVAIGTAISDTLHRRPWYRSLFNIAAQSISYLAMFGVFTLFNFPDASPFSSARGVAAIIAVAGTYEILNSLLVGTVVTLAARQPIQQIYRDSFHFARWVHLITLPLGAVLAALWFSDPWLLIPGVVPLVMAQRAFAAVAGWQAESRRNKALAEEKTRLLEELQLRQEELLRSSKMAALGTFAAGIGHEFNNILAAILGHAQLGRMTGDPEEQNESFDVIMRVCRRGSSISRSLLTFARRSEPRWGMNQIQEAVEDTLALVEHELGKENIQITRRFSPVPLTQCDLGQIGQVVLNLITNARDAMLPAGGMIELELAREHDQIVLAVSDSGPGIPPDVLEQIFQPFVTTKAPGKGTGLGMAICYGIIEQHGGTIKVSSTLGQGTTVAIRLPITTAIPAADGQETAEPPPLNILLVEDEPELSDALARLLAGRGHSVERAAGGVEGLQRYRPRLFDVVVSDAVMPEMNGAVFVQRLRSLDPGMPVLVITGHPESPLIEEMLAAGAAAVLLKPFGIEELLTAIAQAMAHTDPGSRASARGT